MSPGADQYGPAYYEDPCIAKPAHLASRYVDLLSRANVQGVVLDIGCADAGVTLAAAAVPGWSVVGVDLPAAPFARPDDLVAFVAATVEALPFRADAIGGILLLDVIEHLESPYRALLELGRVSRDGCALVVTTPNAGSPFRWIQGRRWFGLHDVTHLYFLTRFSLAHLLRRSGWKPTDTFIRSGSVGLAGRIIGRLRIGGELCIVATPDR